MNDLWTATGQHVMLSFGAVALGTLVAVPVGIYLSRRRRFAEKVLAVIGIVQTIPSLAFLGFALPVLGIGFLPAFVVLLVYSLLPIVRNTYTAISGVDPVLVEAARAMGMTRNQVLWQVEMPLARQVILAGVRVSAVYLISWATLAAFIGAGGLGDLIISGIATYDLHLVLLGAVPAALLAIAANFGFGWLERALTPRGLRTSLV
ncbi:MAG: ABC transporter permease [Clostridia bacterium]|nr:ABC transporter permease [Clostridia bacterium]